MERIEPREQFREMAQRHERHVGEADQRCAVRSARRRGDAARQRTRHAELRIGVCDNLKALGRKPLRERAIVISADRDPAPRAHLDKPRRRVECQRFARDVGEQFVVGAEAPRPARRKQDRANVARLDHRRICSFECRCEHGRNAIMIATSPADILRFALARIGEGVDVTLVTLTGIEGSSPRAIGAQMAVAADGRYVGSFSGGCIEAAVVAEAIDTLADGHGRLVRFGVGSPYLDIRLPCGGGIDLLFNPCPDAAVIAEALARHDRREMGVLRLSESRVDAAAEQDRHPGTGWQGTDFHLCYAPALRIVALGQGDDLLALARLATSFGASVQALSPEPRALTALAAEGYDAGELRSRTELPALMSDPWTAIIFLFHDRDWEEHLLPHALSATAFYVGAIGSQRTQRLRLAALEAAGVSTGLRDRLRTAIGLIPATRDPATLALSILAQLVEEYRLVDSRSWVSKAACNVAR